MLHALAGARAAKARAAATADAAAAEARERLIMDEIEAHNALTEPDRQATLFDPTIMGRPKRR